MTAAPELRDWTASFARRTQSLGGGEITAILALAGATDVITFSGGFPDPATFPSDVLGEIAAKLIAKDVAVALQYSPTEGLPGLRDYLAGRLEALQGRRPAAGELMITSGGIDCMELVAKSMVDTGDVVVVEAPTYLGAIMAFRGYEADLRGVPMDADGMRVDVLADMLAHRAAAQGAVHDPRSPEPDRPVPGGGPPAPALVELARRYHFLILEDVAYRELGFEGIAAAEPVVAGARRGRSSRARSPRRSSPGSGSAGRPGRPRSSRSWSRPSRTPTSARARWASGCSRNTGAAATSTASSSHPARCTRAAPRSWAEALAGHMPEGTSWTTPRGGFFTWVTAPDGMDTVALSPAASARKVAYVPAGPSTRARAGHAQMRLAYSRVDDELIDEGARRLGDLLPDRTGGK